MTDRDSHLTLIRRAKAAVELRRYAEAAQHARAAIAASPENADGHGLLVQALLAQGEAESAKEHVTAALGLAPQNEWLHRLQALALAGVGEYGAALKAADEAVRLAPDESATHYVRAWTLSEAGVVSSARRAASRALELDPRDTDTLNLQGELWLNDDPAKAESFFRRSLEIDPCSVRALAGLGEALDEQDKSNDAAVAFKAAILIDPTHEESKTGLYDAVIGAAAPWWLRQMHRWLTRPMYRATLHLKNLARQQQTTRRGLLTPRIAVGLIILMIAVALPILLPVGLIIGWRRSRWIDNLDTDDPLLRHVTEQVIAEREREED